MILALRSTGAGVTVEIELDFITFNTMGDVKDADGQTLARPWWERAKGIEPQKNGWAHADYPGVRFDVIEVTP